MSSMDWKKLEVAFVQISLFSINFQDLKFLRAMIEDDKQFLEVTALGSKLAWRVMKLWMQSAGRTLNNYQVIFIFQDLRMIRLGKFISSKATL